jgi:hypothetical protein
MEQMYVSVLSHIEEQTEGENRLVQFDKNTEQNVELQSYYLTTETNFITHFQFYDIDYDLEKFGWHCEYGLDDRSSRTETFAS